MRMEIYAKDLPSPIKLLEERFGGEDALIRAAFACSFFAAPDSVKRKTPWFPERARYSTEHYPGKKKGEWAEWKEQNGGIQRVKLDDNSAAQRAWARYSARPIQRRSGYGVRHIWGHPWNPDAFTAGWNLCYMPFWAGMLTEEQHPHPKLQSAFKQASWNLCFGETPVCQPPDFVKDPEMDLESILGEQPILILAPPKDSENAASRCGRDRRARQNADCENGDAWKQILRIRTNANASWKNIRKAVFSLQNKPHEPFGTDNVRSSSLAVVRRMGREAGVSFKKIESLLDENEK